jgi:hypothetical protein
VRTPRDTLKKQWAPGIWEDIEGNIHWSIPDLLAHVGLPNTKENRARAKETLERMIAQHQGRAIYREHPDPESKTFQLLEDKTGKIAIQCLRCGRISHNPNDVRQLYCGHCHQFHRNFFDGQ